MFWVIVMLEDPTTTYLQCSCWGREVFIQDFKVHGSIHWLLSAVGCPVLYEQKLPIMFPPSCLTMVMVFFGLHSPFFIFQTNRMSWCQKAQLWFYLTTALSPKSSESLRCSLANLRWACRIALLGRGTLRHWKITVHYGAVCYHVFSWWVRSSFLIIFTQRARSYIEVQTEDSWWSFCVSSPFQIMAPAVVTFSPGLLLMGL